MTRHELYSPIQIKCAPSGTLCRFIWYSLGLHAVFAVIAIVLIGTQVRKKTFETTTTYLELEQVIPAKQVKKNSRIVQTEQATKTNITDPKVFLGERNQQADRETVKKLLAMPLEATHAQNKTPQNQSRKNPSVLDLTQLGISLRATPADTKKWTQDMMKEDEKMKPGPTGWVQQEYIKNIQVGDRTVLSTREFVYYGYYQRIRSRLDLAWSAQLRGSLMRMYRSGRRLASEMDHVTRVVVILNTQGEITKIKIINESGTQDLDDAAVSAFNQAGPFPNPPKGIVDANNEIQIPWEFIIKT